MSKEGLEFNLADLTNFPVEIFTVNISKEDEEISRFILSLSLVYNDFKTISYFNMVLHNAQPKDMTISPYLGQWCGMNCYNNRSFIGLIHQLVELIANNKNVIVLDDFQKLLKKITKYREISEKVIGSWNFLVDLSDGKVDKHSKYRKIFNTLEKIRSNTVHHYYQTKGLFQGYENHLKKFSGSPSSSFAYASCGNSLESTRYYYADAAAEGYIHKEIDGDFSSQDEFLKTFYEDVNFALKFIIEKYLKKKRSALQSRK